MNQTAHEVSSGQLPDVVVDRQRLLELVDHDLDLLREIVDLFLEDAPSWIQAIREAVDNDDGAALENGAHALKGAVSSFAAQRMWAIAARLEQLGARGEVSGAVADTEALDAEWQALAAELQTMTA